VVGAGPEEPALHRRIGALGLEAAVIMAGYAADPAEVVASFDIAVYPSLSSEGMGRVVFEYMAAGRPIVATRIGLAGEALEDGRTAWLVEPGDAEGLASAVESALASPAQAARAARACRRLVETEYSGTVLAQRLEALYRDALDRALVPSPAP
jgi:glycosyltransferase involved in cell wall biosynthesis